MRHVFLLAMMTLPARVAALYSIPQLIPRVRVAMSTQNMNDVPTTSPPQWQDNGNVKTSVIAQAVLCCAALTLFAPIMSVAVLFLGPVVLFAAPALVRDNRMGNTVMKYTPLDTCRLLSSDEDGVSWYECTARPDTADVVCEFAVNTGSGSGFWLCH